ncbi:marginal zone B- and B1-cell-specific protein-like isoform X2 [Penaeus japonicus]|nr:marginal zone B- and B1-cell-specific protein-like isoform X2 [Penaeus japonicus]
MKTLGIIWMFIILYASAAGDVDFIDTDGVNDPEAALKCDACKTVAYKFAESFSKAQGDLTRAIALKDDEIVEAAEGTCDDLWQGYGSIKVNDEERLTGPGTNFDTYQDEAEEDEGLWSRRLQDLCDELLAEVSEEKVLYNLWASDNSLEDYLCRGDGLFGACSSDFWGSWPGEDYEDYDDGDDFEYMHDEF